MNQFRAAWIPTRSCKYFISISWSSASKVTERSSKISRTHFPINTQGKIVNQGHREDPEIWWHPDLLGAVEWLLIWWSSLKRGKFGHSWEVSMSQWFLKQGLNNHRPKNVRYPALMSNTTISRGGSLGSLLCLIRLVPRTLSQKAGDLGSRVPLTQKGFDPTFPLCRKMP